MRTQCARKDGHAYTEQHSHRRWHHRCPLHVRAQPLGDNRARTDAEGHQQTQDRQGEDVLQGISIRPTDGKQKHSQDFSIEQAERNKCLTPVLRTLFNEAIITMKFG